MEDSFYAFVCKSSNFEGEAYTVVNASSMVKAMKIFANRFFGEIFYDVRVFEFEFNKNGLAELYPEE